MARLPRAVVAGLAHHVTQRGNRSQLTFFSDDDYRVYLNLMAEWCGKRGVKIWAYCLMPNHVHLIAVPSSAGALCAGIGEAHRRYTLMVNLREDWRGCLWQGRFASYVMDEARLLTCARYVETNPVRAGLAARPEDWEWSSARAHLAGEDDLLVDAGALLTRVPYAWGKFLELSTANVEVDLLRRHERTGRPLGSVDFVKKLERRLDRPLLPRKPGPKPGRD